MVGTTATQELRYPLNTDAPCDGDLYVRWLAEDIEARLLLHDEAIGFTLSPPSLVLVRSEPLVFPATGTTGTLYENPIEFDAVESQTGGEFGAFEVNPGMWHVPRAGIYQMGFSAQWGQDPGIPSATNLLVFELRRTTNLFASSAGSDTGLWSMTQARAYPTGDGMSLSGLVRAPDVEEFFFFGFDDNQLLTSFEFTSARAYAFWVADL